MGLSEEFIDNSCPCDLEPYETAYRRKLEDLDLLFFYNGLYTLRAVQVAFDSSRKVEYFDEPIIKTINKNIGKTQEEIDNEELAKMLAAEEAWIVNSKLAGLPETKI